MKKYILEIYKNMKMQEKVNWPLKRYGRFYGDGSIPNLQTQMHLKLQFSFVTLNGKINNLMVRI